MKVYDAASETLQPAASKVLRTSCVLARQSPVRTKVHGQQIDMSIYNSARKALVPRHSDLDRLNRGSK